MANKLYAMELLTEEVAKDVAANPQEWMRFLNTASRLYRYTFPEQLLIYAQRPGATAVASMEIWNQKMYRWIKKGSKGIALIDNTSGPKTKLRYVFDVQDTYKVKNLGRDPQLWNLNPEGEQLVADYLQERLALEATEGGLAEVLHQAAEESVQAWLPDAFDELQMDVAGTFLEDLDEQNQKVEFRELMTNSVWYVLLNRCGLDVQEYLDAEDFRHITDFNQLKVIGHLGSSVNEISRPVLMQIGRYVLNDLEKDLKTVAKEKEVAYNEFNTLIRESKTRNTEDRGENKEETEHERDHLQPEWGVPDSGYQSGGDERNDREVRIDEERVSEKPQSSQIQHSDLTEPSGQSSDGNRQPGKAESRQPDVRTSGEKPGTGQNGRRDGMDQTHEPDQSTGRGTGNSGDYLQLSLFPTDLEQREGRINRFKCLAIRQNVADKYGKADGITFKRDIWTEMFEAAKAEKQNDQSELVPFWCFGKNQSVKIERLVPMYPMSKDEVNYERLIKILSLYRLTLGQARQEELLEYLFKEFKETSGLKKLFIDLSPFSKGKEG